MLKYKNINLLLILMVVYHMADEWIGYLNFIIIGADESKNKAPGVNRN